MPNHVWRDILFQANKARRTRKSLFTEFRRKNLHEAVKSSQGADQGRQGTWKDSTYGRTVGAIGIWRPSMPTTDLGHATGHAIRAAARGGQLTTPTPGLGMGYVQANLVVLPKELAFDFLLFCHRNPKPCPLLDV